MVRVNQTAVALGKAVQSVDRATGVSHSFTVHMSKADGSRYAMVHTSVIALNWADAWSLMGTAIGKFMNGEHGRVVHSITSERP